MAETAPADKAIADAAHNANQGNPAMDVRKWLLKAQKATLGTISTREGVRGFPMGSIVPFCVDKKGRPIILISTIAAHTRNLISDNRANLFINDPGSKDDPQSRWRASIMGRFSKLVTDGKETGESCELITVDEFDEIMARYVERVPNARGYLKTHDFHFWRLSKIETIRYIAGFGRICWIDGNEYHEQAVDTTLNEMQVGAMSHMNDDHEENMKEICRHFYDVNPNSVQMQSLDVDGCLFKTTEPDGLYFTSFTKIVKQPDEFKTAIIKLLKLARSGQS